jgi:hypothetical protein
MQIADVVGLLETECKGHRGMIVSYDWPFRVADYPAVRTAGGKYFAIVEWADPSNCLRLGGAGSPESCVMDSEGIAIVIRTDRCLEPSLAL